ncbi:TlyA family RNA methyltransferase [Fervidobacterium thailandense]|nr:TlyA family RNA methyltransferase [Fervidobacterium thailandense]
MRLDVFLVEKGLVESRSKARWVVENGHVKVNGIVCTKVSKKVSPGDVVEVVENLKYVSRAGYKLEGLFEEFPVELTGKIVCDIGSSTGGFVDFFLQHGASKVYAVDVNVEQLHEKLKRDQRVVPIRANAKELDPSLIAEELDFISIDVSFISVRKLVQTVKKLASAKTKIIVLIKPQFEIPEGHKGVVRDKLIHVEAIKAVLTTYREAGFDCEYLTYSKMKGAEGNIEFFAVFRVGGEKNVCNEIIDGDIITVVERAWEDNG